MDAHLKSDSMSNQSSSRKPKLEYRKPSLPQLNFIAAMKQNQRSVSADTKPTFHEEVAFAPVVHASESLITNRILEKPKPEYRKPSLPHLNFIASLKENKRSVSADNKPAFHEEVAHKPSVHALGSIGTKRTPEEPKLEYLKPSLPQLNSIGAVEHSQRSFSANTKPTFREKVAHKPVVHVAGPLSTKHASQAPELGYFEPDFDKYSHSGSSDSDIARISQYFNSGRNESQSPIQAEGLAIALHRLTSIYAANVQMRQELDDQKFGAHTFNSHATIPTSQKVATGHRKQDVHKHPSPEQSPLYSSPRLPAHSRSGSEATQSPSINGVLRDSQAEDLILAMHQLTSLYAANIQMRESLNGPRSAGYTRSDGKEHPASSKERRIDDSDIEELMIAVHDMNTLNGSKGNLKPELKVPEPMAHKHSSSIIRNCSRDLTVNIIKPEMCQLNLSPVRLCQRLHVDDLRPGVCQPLSLQADSHSSDAQPESSSDNESDLSEPAPTIYVSPVAEGSEAEAESEANKPKRASLQCAIFHAEPELWYFRPESSNYDSCATTSIVTSSERECTKLDSYGASSPLIDRSVQEPEVEYLKPSVYQPPYPGHNPWYTGPRLSTLPSPGHNEPTSPSVKHFSGFSWDGELERGERDVKAPYAEVSRFSLDTESEDDKPDTNTPAAKSLDTARRWSFHDLLADFLRPSESGSVSSGSSELPSKEPEIELLKPTVYQPPYPGHNPWYTGPRLDTLPSPGCGGQKSLSFKHFSGFSWCAEHENDETDVDGPECASSASSAIQDDDNEWRELLYPEGLNVPSKQDLPLGRLSRPRGEADEALSEAVSPPSQASFTSTLADSDGFTEPVAVPPPQLSSVKTEIDDRVPKHKVLWGENGLLGLKEEELSPKGRPASRLLGGLKKKLKQQLAEFVSDSSYPHLISPLISNHNVQVDEPHFGLKRKASNAASFAAPGSSPASLTTSLDSDKQAKLYAELEVLICNTANDFILEQYYAGRISQHSIDKVNAGWNNKNQHHVNEFRFDQATQRELIVANRRRIAFTGDSARLPICVQTNLHNWKCLAREMSVRTFCLPDSAIRKHLFDLRQIITMMNPKLDTLMTFQRVSSEINDQMLDKEVAERRRSEALRKKGQLPRHR
ncbi:hypothetical protein N7539_003696 [Penicillium diatomitis]|uniref:Uncharacterized protein n=1 Tax=Penicillium diatomitis TaxID=2819901 RepID=A0A9W9XCS7_9EURO|nr:uncharacterized protein N7539_003696 [Penicillium diatomitis]KAJ5488806.1 hypothetical protein N7539_003696 [Penicillium diatomitis]